MTDKSSMNRAGMNRRRRHQQETRKQILMVAGIVVLVFALGFGIAMGVRAISRWVHSILDDPTEPAVSTSALQPEETTQSAEERYAQQLAEAEHLAQQYDYAAAARLLQSISGYDKVPVLTDRIAWYLNAQAALKRADITKICHVYFQSLIVEPELAFRAAEASSYNRSMTTLEEFYRILEQLYEKGYVLVSMHDMAYTDASGNFARGSIMLPEGKLPLVLSVEDLNYYEYMAGDGFASKLVLDETGRPVNEMQLADGSTKLGDFDVVPILERFIEEHPDFSYHGAKGLICLTGYEGILGYRTAPKYGNPSDPDYKAAYRTIDVEAERRQAAAVAAVLKELGWEFASHSWGHINMSNADLGRIQADTVKWLEQVAPLVGGTDILVFAHGADIGSWRNYSSDNEKFRYLKSVGFRYFCNVDSTNIPWVQYNASAGYLRQGRVNLAGYEMTYYADRLRALIDSETILDKRRPQPVPRN